MQVFAEEADCFTDDDEERTEEHSSESVDCGTASEKTIRETVSESELVAGERELVTAGGDELDYDEESEEDSENEEEEQRVEDLLVLESLSLENKQHRPHRDEAESTCSVTSTARSYLHKTNEHLVRKLVRKSVDKHHKQLQRMARGKKGAKPPTPAGRRSKKGNRTELKQLSNEW